VILMMRRGCPTHCFKPTIADERTVSVPFLIFFITGKAAVPSAADEAADSQIRSQHRVQ
jgi:hypothetical protein